MCRDQDLPAVHRLIWWRLHFAWAHFQKLQWCISTEKRSWVRGCDPASDTALWVEFQKGCFQLDQIGCAQQSIFGPLYCGDISGRTADQRRGVKPVKLPRAHDATEGRQSLSGRRPGGDAYVRGGQSDHGRSPVQPQVQSERCHAIISLPTMPALSAATPSGGGALLGYGRVSRVTDRTTRCRRRRRIGLQASVPLPVSLG